MNVFLIPTALCFIIALGLVAVSLTQNVRSPINRAVAFNGFFIAVWAVGVGGQFLSVTEDQAWFWYRLATSAGMLNGPWLIWYFLCVAELSFRKKLMTAFPFFFIAAVMIIPNLLFPLWYSGFVFTAVGPVGLPTNPTAWVAFYAVTIFYVWAYVYFSSISGYGSQRLAWLSRSFRNAVITAIGLYLTSLVLEVLLLLPHFSGFSFGALVCVWFYQAIRYGFLSPAWSGRNLDVLLSLKTPLAYLSPEGAVLRLNAAFVTAWSRDQNGGPTYWNELFADAPVWEEVWKNLKAGQSDVVFEAAPRGGRVFKVVLSPDRDRFGDLAGAVLQISQTEDLARRLEGFGLTEREIQLAIQLGQGLSYQEIADRSFISPSTVRVHCHNILEKVGADDRAGLIRLLTRSE